MAINQIAYTVNPLNSRSVGVNKSVAATTTTTVYTAVANDKVSSFSISTTGIIGTSGTDKAQIQLIIGSASFSTLLDSSASPGTKIIITSDQLGYKGGFLQATDTIVLVVTSIGTPTGSISVGLAIDNYTA